MKRRSWILAGLASLAVAFGAMVAAHGAGEAPPLWTFSPGTAAKASEVNFNFSALGDQITANVPRRTRLDYSTRASSNGPFTVLAWQKLRTLATTFTKQRADTDIVLDLNTQLLVNGNSAQIQLRVDDATDGPANGGLLIRLLSGAAPIEQPGSLKSVFKGLSAATHTVSIWVRTLDGMSAVSENDDLVDRTVFVEESPSR